FRHRGQILPQREFRGLDARAQLVGIDRHGFVLCFAANVSAKAGSCASMKMNAIGVEKPGPGYRLVLHEAPKPAPASGEVLIKVAAAGVNHADLAQAKGHYPPPPGASEILGLEVSGEIAALG